MITERHVPSAWMIQRVMSLARDAFQRLREQDGLIIETDDEILAALSEGNVDAERMLQQLVVACLDAEANYDAATARLEDLSKRRERFLRNKTALRVTIQSVMETLALRRYNDAEVSATISAGRPKLLITDEAAIPDSLCEYETTRTPNKMAIRTALAIAPVPGAMLGNGGSTLTLRTK